MGKGIFFRNIKDFMVYFTAAAVFRTLWNRSKPSAVNTKLYELKQTICCEKICLELMKRHAGCEQDEQTQSHWIHFLSNSFMFA